MSEVWKTKYGPRRVRHEAPTLEEAIFAAKGLTDDPNEQVAIAAALMNVTEDEARVAMLKSAQRKDIKRAPTSRVTFTKRAGVERAVVVERKGPRVARSLDRYKLG